MIPELDLIQTNLGIYNLGDWPISVATTQLNKPETDQGVYVIINIQNGMMLIGEGGITGSKNRPMRHLKDSQNKLFNKDLKKYGKESFVLWGIIPDKDEIQRKLIENKLQIYFGDRCYNRPRRQYPTQQELLNNIASTKNRYRSGNIVERLNNYTKIQRVEKFDECWESNYSTKRNGYSIIRFNLNPYDH